MAPWQNGIKAAVNVPTASGATQDSQDGIMET